MPVMGSRLTPITLRLLRLLRLGLHLARGVAVAALCFPFFSQARRDLEIKRWSTNLLHILAVRLHVHGVPSTCDTAPRMLVANHVSWLDIFAINAVMPVRFVAKSEVRRWPVIGWLCRKTGTLFIEREQRRDTVRLNRLIQETLRAGDAVAVFPEATSTDGSQVRKFHGSLLQSALGVKAVLLPVAIRYGRADGSLCVEAAYDGEKSLWDTLRLMLTQRRIDAHLYFLPPLATDNQRRRELAQASRELIVQQLYPSSRCNRTA
jgi:1-acyl-sn-glycerol-3-phosphate acyltransferase